MMSDETANESVIERRGHCLCGAIQVTATQAGSRVCACHCDMCRRWGGGPFMEIECGSAVSIEGDQHLSVFESSEWAERGFCNQCGTHLFYRLKGTMQHMIPVGIFADVDGLEFKKQVFVDEKPSFYAFANDTEEVTGQELFAQFSEPG